MTPNRSEEKSAALSNLTNYIAQEAYRASIIQEHTDEYNRIHHLLNEVEQALSTSLKKELTAGDIQELAELIVDHIVLELPRDQLLAGVSQYLAMLDQDGEEGSWFNSVSKFCIDITSKISESYGDWNTNIHHRYPPATLTWPLVLEHALIYITEKHYETSVQTDEKGSKVYSYTNLPFSLSQAEAKPVCYRFREHHSQQQTIPDNSLYKRINQDEREKIHITTGEQLSALCALEFINAGIDSVSTINQLQLTIDLSNPISKRELERMLFDLHNRIWQIQWSNSSNSMLLAEDLNQLEKAHNIPDLGRLNLIKHLDFTKAEIEGINSLTDTKNSILGLMVWHHHFTAQKFSKLEILPVISYRRPKQNLDESFDQIINKIKQSQRDGTAQHIRGFELSTLKKGYETISKAIQVQLIEQRAGRYQDRKLSPQRKEALLQSPDFNSDNLHPNDIEAVNTRIEKLNANQFDGLLKQHSDGSIWVVPRKR
jgi:hypothetical protein